MNYEIISKHRTELMGAAIIGILFCHLRECLEIHDVFVPSLISLFSRGICGVDIFMLLSGFGLYYSYRNNSNIHEFYKNRIFRLLPAYFIVAIPYWLIIDIFRAQKPFYEFLKDLLFISFFQKGTSIFWFIPAIFIFSLIFPILWSFLFGKCLSGIDSIGVKTCFLLTAAIAVDSLCLNLIPWYQNITIMAGRFPAFIIGIYLGYKSYLKEEISIFMLLLIPGVKILLHFLYNIPALNNFLNLFNIHYLDTVLGLLVFEILLIILNFFDPTIISKPLILLGQITLEVYLLHMALLTLFENPANYCWYVIICVITPTITGWILHCMLEKREKFFPFSF